MHGWNRPRQSRMQPRRCSRLGDIVLGINWQESLVRYSEPEFLSDLLEAPGDQGLCRFRRISIGRFVEVYQSSDLARAPIPSTSKLWDRWLPPQTPPAMPAKKRVFGGFGTSGEHLSTGEVYDPASDSWAQVSSLTSARNSMVAIAL